MSENTNNLDNEETQSDETESSVENKVEAEASSLEEKTKDVSSDESSEESDEPKEERILALGDTPDFKWYVVHVLSGYENRVSKTLKERIVNHNMTELFAEIMYPEENVVANVNGKKRNMKKKYFPGYILVKMVMNDKTWHLVKNTDKITGFIGGAKHKPMPISDEEATALTKSMDEGFKKTRSVSNFSEGDQVKVMEGPFASFVGTVEAVSDKGKVKVNVSIFGRPTPVELEFSQVEKV